MQNIPYLKVDEMHFTNVINNLIDNAVKYNDKSPLIKINTFNIIIGIQIEVIDNGVGLSKEDQQKVFEKFYRVSKGNVHDTKGFGLGLSYVQSIVEKHNGKFG
jgi:two-component system phosphate regulon sensor histidine kinase PhoR